MRKPLLPNLSIDYILKHISPEEIFSRYWNMPIHEITEAIVRGKATYAPYRDDNNPSLGFYENNGKLYARDWAGYFWGDCFDAVAFTIGRGREGKEFGKVLEQIAKDFQLHRFAKSTSTEFNIRIDRTPKLKQRLQFTVERRDWNIPDKVFWFDQYYVGSEFLESQYVYPVANLYINGLLRYTYDARNPAYAYYLGEDSNGVALWKIYKPFAVKGKDNKFVQNCATIEGSLHLKQAKIGVITKSNKDRIAIMNLANIHHLPILAVAPPSESTVLNKYQMDTLLNYAPIWYTLSDYDRTGILFAGRMRRLFDTIPLFFTRGKFGKPDFKNKDFTDNLAWWGDELIVKLMKYIVEHGHQDLLKYVHTL